MTAALAMQSSQLRVPDFTPTYEIFLDVESYYDAEYSLKRLTTTDYVRSEKFECVGVGVDDGDEQVWLEAHEFEAWAKTVPWHQVALGCHHAHFDGLVLSHHFGVVPAAYYCTMSMARAYGIDGGVGLENLAEHFGVGHKGHEVENAKGKHRKDFTQEEWEQYGRYCKNDNALTRGIFDAMVAKGFPESELWLIDSTVRMFTQPKLFVDDGLLRGFLVEERARKAGLLQRIEKDKSLVMSGDRFAGELKTLGVEPPTKTSPKTKKQIWAFAKNDVGMQELLEHEDDEVRWLAEARIAHKSTINETRAERFLRMGQGGRTLPVYLRYAAAHTFRWGGSDKTNLQNLQRTNKKDPRRGVLRKSLLAPLGHKVLSADSGAIEARVVAWLAGHDELVEAFALNRDIYSEFASEIWGRKVDRKKNAEDEIPGFVAKICVLGLSYSMGWQKLSDSFLKGAMNGPPVKFGWVEAQQMGVDLNKWYQDERKVERVRSMVSRLPIEELMIHCAVTDTIVKKYRKVNKPIVDFWHTMEQVLEAMCEDDADYSFGPNDCLRVVRHGIILPNGLTLKYPGLKFSAEDSLGGEEGFSYLGQYGKQRQRMYGGAACENLTQAIARCIVAEQLLHFRAVTGYSPCLFAHDELSYVVPDRDADALLNILKETMRTPPAWAAGLPLSVEGGYANSYGAAK